MNKNKIKLFIMDVDGTLTDGKIYMGERDEVCKVFNVKDGWGIKNMLIPAGICPVIITGRTSKMLEKRCEELGIEEVYQRVDDKVSVLLFLLEKHKCKKEMVAYIGDDFNDWESMMLIKRAGGVVGCPKDSVTEVKKIADYVSDKDGGCGAVRTFIEWILCEGNN